MDGGIKTVELMQLPASPDGRTLDVASAAQASPPPDEQASKPPYPPIATLPTQLASHSIRFDFNHGARIVLPQRDSGQWRVRLSDLDSGNILFQTENSGATVKSTKRYFVRFRIEVSQVDPNGTVRRLRFFGQWDKLRADRSKEA